MAIAQRVAGYSLGAADVLRRAMGKKKLDVLNLEYERFFTGMHDNGFSDGAIKTLWDLLVPFSDYAFNRAHSAGYGLLSYWTAYLKVHHPCEYMAALLTSTGDDKDRTAVYLAEARKMGITVLPPDVNASAAAFAAVGDHSIRVGLSAIRNVGDGAVKAITTGRPYADFGSYLHQVDTAGVNKRVVESLILAGGFDSFGHSRAGLRAVHEQAIKAASAARRAHTVGQLDLFGEAGQDAAFEVAIPAADWPIKDQLAAERDMLGLYVSDHPLRGMEHALEDATPIATVIEGGVQEGESVTVAGILSAVSRKTNRAGQPWAVCTLEDLAAGIELVVFARTYVQVGELLRVDAVVRVAARVGVRDDRVMLIADGVSLADVTAVS